MFRLKLITEVCQSFYLLPREKFFKSFCAHVHSKQNVKWKLGRVYCSNFSIAVGQMYSYNALDFVPTGKRVQHKCSQA